jgi:hypothetical protein
LILLDPASPFDDEFKKVLSKKEYRQSGVNKTGSLRAAKHITAAGFGFALRPLLQKGIPFCYHEFDPEIKKDLLRNLCRSNTYRTALEEYFFSHSDADTKEITDAVSQGILGSMKIYLLTHSSDIYTEELMRYGGIREDTRGEGRIPLAGNHVQILTPFTKVRTHNRREERTLHTPDR